MNILDQFSTDKELELNGVWVEIGDGTTLCVARLYNDRYSEALRGAMKPHKRQVMDNESSLEIMIDVEARTVLIGWEGVTETDSASAKTGVAYSIEKAKEYLHVRDFRKLVLEIAGSMETYKSQEREDGEKN
ncbi:MAG: hypothetical protein GY794_16320 [bacterium]|nr:hypothetical protein [bacterium]